MKRRLRRLYVRLLRAPGPSREIALGMAIGMVVAWVPAVQTPIALLTVAALRLVGVRASYLTATIGTFLTNPITAVPLYALSLLVGRPLARLGLAALEQPSTIWLETALAFAAGGLVLGVPLAILGYHVTVRAVDAYRVQRAARRASRRIEVLPANA